MSYLKLVIYTILFLSFTQCSKTSVIALSQSPESNDQQILNNVLKSEKLYSKKRNEKRSQQWLHASYGKADNIRHLEKCLDTLKQVDPNNLSFDDQITFDFLMLVLQDRLDLLMLDDHLMPLNSEGGFLTSMFYSAQYISLKDSTKKADYYQKLNSTAEYLKQQTRHLNQGLEENITVAVIVAQSALNVLQNQLSVSDDNHFLMQPVSKTGDENYYNRCLELFKTNIKPAFKAFAKYLETEYIPNTRSIIGVSENSNGKAYYEQRTRYYTTLDMTPKDVYETGQTEVARIRSEMDVILKELNFTEGLDSFYSFLRTDPQFYAKTPKELLHHAAWLSKKAEAFLPRYFETLPRLPFTVVPVPDDIAPNYTAGRYSSGSYEDHRPGSYWVNTYDLKSRPLYLLPALTLHEAVPGHHLQGSLAQEMEDVPSIRQNTYLSAFGEGWALYCEYLGKEAGFYETLYEDFGRLTYEMWRACRLVVDPGMHYYGWTRDEAVDFMASNTALSWREVNTEIDRYIGWPGQAVSYKIGELKIKHLRQQAQYKLKDKFDIRAFHNKIVENGSVPLQTLERIIDKYISETLNEEN